MNNENKDTISNQELSDQLKDNNEDLEECSSGVDYITAVCI